MSPEFENRAIGELPVVELPPELDSKVMYKTVKYAFNSAKLALNVVPGQWDKSLNFFVTAGHVNFELHDYKDALFPELSPMLNLVLGVHFSRNLNSRAA